MEKRYVVLVTLSCTCLVLTLLFVQWRHIRLLRLQLMDLEHTVSALRTGQEGARCLSGTCCGVGECTPEYSSVCLSVFLSVLSGPCRDLLRGRCSKLYTIIKFYLLQVLYKDNTWVMGHVITKRLKGAETKLMKCLKSMPSNLSEPVNTCYTAGVHYLESGSVLELSVPRQSAELILWSHATFMGIFSI
ncbi:tumor necrosis factor ligand superfamily member 13-like [Astyanax mexicanus]|uniref:Tumor necrosis factor ligand superfamily member 13-like n=1 Tax=Astyanax mexicanus TaxID=7994 RepID=A0A8T2MJB3_ASTMX|nr:tumor necrosis factor ligand superfamily member 13-like [Astyanax mexicanus]